ncbi:conserved hypothetical protein [Ricinus communis]|uniref:Uncharacterized protein n=1 Tax=Ricinus communis TaxID=3988 RepID=B9RPU2_RICCO|nr:conserved hypothetical protein [Ricinus communis]
MTERAVEQIGNYVGSYVKSDPNNFSGIWRNYVRIRVFVDSRNALKRLMRMKKA